MLSLPNVLAPGMISYYVHNCYLYGMEYFNLKIRDYNITVIDIGNGFYKVSLNNSGLGNMLSRNGKWILQGEHPFTDEELQVIGTEIQNKFINS